MPKSVYFLPKYGAANRIFTYKPHWQYIYLRGADNINKVVDRNTRYSDPHTGALRTSKNIINAGRPDDLPFMPTLTDMPTASKNLSFLVHPKFRHLGTVPWFISPKRAYQRPRTKLHLFVYDLIHTLTYRKPPPGPFFFHAAPDSSSFRLLMNFYAVHDQEHNFWSQPFPQANVSGSLLDKKPAAFQLHKLCWFNPRNPHITWNPATLLWDTYYSHPRLDKPYRNHHTAWNYWRACAALEQHLLVDNDMSDTDICSQPNGQRLFECLLDYERYIPKPANTGNRFFTRYQPDLACLRNVHGFTQRQLDTHFTPVALRNKPEHPHMPLWLSAVEDKEKLLYAHLSPATRALEDFAGHLALHTPAPTP